MTRTTVTTVETRFTCDRCGVKHLALRTDATPPEDWSVCTFGPHRTFHYCAGCSPYILDALRGPATVATGPNPEEIGFAHVLASQLAKMDDQSLRRFLLDLLAPGLHALASRTAIKVMAKAFIGDRS